MEPENIHRLSDSRRQHAISTILSFISDHRESYASLAVCRRALNGGLDSITGSVVHDLGEYLKNAPDDEIEAYYYIVQ